VSKLCVLSDGRRLRKAVFNLPQRKKEKRVKIEKRKQARTMMVRGRGILGY